MRLLKEDRIFFYYVVQFQSLIRGHAQDPAMTGQPFQIAKDWTADPKRSGQYDGDVNQ